MEKCGSEFQCGVTCITQSVTIVKDVKLIGDEVANELGLRGLT